VSYFDSFRVRNVTIIQKMGMVEMGATHSPSHVQNSLRLSNVLNDVRVSVSFSFEVPESSMPHCSSVYFSNMGAKQRS